MPFKNNSAGHQLRLRLTSSKVVLAVFYEFCPIIGKCIKAIVLKVVT